MARGPTCRDDAYDIVPFFFPVGMDDNQKKDVFNGADGLPSFFTLAFPFDEGDAERIIEYELGRFEVDAMFSLVARVLLLIPVESHHA